MAYETFVLKNGLSVYCEPKPLGEIAAHVIVKAGHWRDSIPETAHTLEHVIGAAAHVYGEKGSLNYTDTNALTKNKVTVYYFSCALPKHLSQIMGNLTGVFNPPDTTILAREKGAVTHELSPQLNPLQDFSDEVFKTIFPIYGKSRPSIKERLTGLDRIDRQTVIDFWETHYRTTNVVLYLGGDINPKEIDFSRFEMIPKKEVIAPPLFFAEEPLLKERTELQAHIRNDTVTSITIAYQAPSFPRNMTFREGTAQGILLGYLAADHGPLYQRLRDELNLCYNLSIGYEKDIGTSAILQFNITTRPDKQAIIEHEWGTTLKKISKEGIPIEILEMIRDYQQIRRAHAAQQFTPEGIFNEIDNHITEELFQSTIETITPEDVAKAAQHFVDKPYVISIALPK